MSAFIRVLRWSLAGVATGGFFGGLYGSLNSQALCDWKAEHATNYGCEINKVSGRHLLQMVPTPLTQSSCSYSYNCTQQAAFDQAARQFNEDFYASFRYDIAIGMVVGLVAGLSEGLLREYRNPHRNGFFAQPANPVENGNVPLPELRAAP